MKNVVFIFIAALSIFANKSFADDPEAHQQKLDDYHQAVWSENYTRAVYRRLAHFVFEGNMSSRDFIEVFGQNLFEMFGAKSNSYALTLEDSKNAANQAARMILLETVRCDESISPSTFWSTESRGSLSVQFIYAEAKKHNCSVSKWLQTTQDERLSESRRAKAIQGSITETANTLKANIEAEKNLWYELKVSGVVKRSSILGAMLDRK